MTALSRLSKCSTVFLCDPQGAGAAALATDISQRRTNITNNATYVSEANSARTALGYPRAVSIVVNATNTSSGVLVYHGTAGGYSYRVRINGGAAEVAENGSLITSVALPGMVASARKALIHWSQRAEDSSVRSELTVYNFVTGQWAFSSALHSATTPLATNTLTIGAAHAGATTFSGGVSAFFTVRIDQRHVSGTEAREDFVSQSTAPTLTGRHRTPLLTFPTSEMSIADEGELAGPVYLMAAAATRQADSRLVGAPVNLVVRSPTIEDNTYSPVRYYREAPFDDRYHMAARYLFHAPISPKANKARVRLHTRCYNSKAAPTIATCYFSMLSMDKLPNQPGALLCYRTTAATVSSPQATPGGWVDLGLLNIARDENGLSYLCLAHSIGLDAGLSVEDETLIKINAITIEPLMVENSGGGYDADVDIMGD